MREQYQALMADPAKIEAILLAGAAKATALSAPFMRELREAVGLRKLAAPTVVASKQKSAKSNLPSFKQYREADGLFYFKLLSSGGTLLLQSHGFAAAKEAALAIAALQQHGTGALPALADKLQAVPDIDAADATAALTQLMQGQKSNQ